jgi:hypothetical protein
MITTPTVSGKPGQAPTGLSCDLYPLIGSHSTWTDPRGPVKMITREPTPLRIPHGAGPVRRGPPERRARGGTRRERLSRCC